MNAYETIDGILRGLVSSEPTRRDTTTMLVQNDALVTEDDYQIRYVAVYDPVEGVANVEAYALLRAGKLSFYDFDSHEIYIDDQFIGKRSDITALDGVVAEYGLERGPNLASPGAGDALYAALKTL
jgi:hypothetical protein